MVTSIPDRKLGPLLGGSALPLAVLAMARKEALKVRSYVRLHPQA
jgi:hypothetical protein